MKIKLTQPFASNTKADEYETRQIKIALNRLNYYTPDKDTGITTIPEKNIFIALKEFQADQDISATGRIKPDDETEKALNASIQETSETHYIWNTVGDGNVRASHAALEGTKQSWNASPSPGDEPGCRCWATPVKKEMTCEQLDIERQNEELNLDDATEKMLEIDKKAKQLGQELQNAWDNIKGELKEIGIDVAIAFAPNPSKLPIISGVLAIGKSATRIKQLYNHYIDIWNKLSQANKEREEYRKRVKEVQDRLAKIFKQREKLGCK